MANEGSELSKLPDQNCSVAWYALPVIKLLETLHTSCHSLHISISPKRQDIQR